MGSFRFFLLHCKLGLQSSAQMLTTGMCLVPDIFPYCKLSKLFPGLSACMFTVPKLTGPDNPTGYTQGCQLSSPAIVLHLPKEKQTTGALSLLLSPLPQLLGTAHKGTVP